MTPTGAPADAFAVIVGVEQCGVFADDPLRGPVRDAIAWFDWFVACGVKPARIAMFLAPKPDSQPLVDAWSVRRGEAPEATAPTEAALRGFVSGALAQQAKAAAQQGRTATLFVTWSGHGLIDQRDLGRSRRLLYADGTADAAVNLEPVSFMKALRSANYAGFAEQMLIVDACANPVVGLSRTQRLLRPTDFGEPNFAAGIRQQVLLSAAPGELARTAASGGADTTVTLFASRLREALGEKRPPGAPPWPDFDAAFAMVRQRFAADDGGRQTPVDWCIGVPDDVLPDAGVPMLRDARDARLLPRLAPVTEQVLNDAFYDALKTAATPLVATPEHHLAAANGRVAMAHLLTLQASRPGDLPPLARWAQQVLWRLLRQRGAAVAGATDAQAASAALAVDDWLQEDDRFAATLAGYRQRHAPPAEATVAPTPCYLLVIEQGGDAAAGPHVLDGWLFGGDPLQACALTDDEAPLRVEADGSGRGLALKTLLDRALQAAKAELRIARPEVVVEWALPAERVDEAVETLPVGLPGRERRLGTLQLVVRRLRDRLDALHSGIPTMELDRWERSARLLRERLGAQGLRIAWLDPQRIRDDGLEAQIGGAPGASCIGLARTPASATLDDPLKWALYDDGLPFACWSEADWADGEQERLDTDLRERDGLPPLLHAQRLRQRLQDGQRHPCARLRLLWDDPEHDPYATRLQAVQRTG